MQFRDTCFEFFAVVQSLCSSLNDAPAKLCSCEPSATRLLFPSVFVTLQTCKRLHKSRCTVRKNHFVACIIQCNQRDYLYAGKEPLRAVSKKVNLVCKLAEFMVRRSIIETALISNNFDSFPANSSFQNSLSCERSLRNSIIVLQLLP